MNNWPPKDWRALVALVFSVLGAVVLTALVWWLCASLLPDAGWSEASENSRAFTLRWVLWIATLAIGLVLLGLGFAINRRSLRGRWGDKSLDWEGGDQDAPPQTPGEAARVVADKAETTAQRIEEATDGH